MGFSEGKEKQVLMMKLIIYLFILNFKMIGILLHSTILLFARQKVANSKYFHGSLFDYINMYNRTMMSFEENDYYNTDTFELF